MPDSVVRAIDGIEFSATGQVSGIKLIEKLKALELLGRETAGGMFTVRQQVIGSLMVIERPRPEPTPTVVQVDPTDRAQMTHATEAQA